MLNFELDIFPFQLHINFRWSIDTLLSLKVMKIKILNYGEHKITLKIVFISCNFYISAVCYDLFVYSTKTELQYKNSNLLFFKAKCVMSCYVLCSSF